MPRPRNKHGISRREYDSQRSVYVQGNPACSKLDADKVRAIRASIASSSALARSLGVTEGTIRAVRTFITWRHVR